MKVKDHIIVTNYLIYKFYKNNLYDKDLEIDVDGYFRIKIDNKTIFSLKLFTIYIRLQYSLELAKTYVDSSDHNILPEDDEIGEELSKDNMFIGNIELEFKIDGKKASISFSFGDYSGFRYYYDRANRKLDLVYYKKSDNAIVSAYELPVVYENVVIYCRNPKKYKRISYRFAKQIFDYLRDVKAFCNILDMPDDIIVGVYYDVERGDFTSIYHPYVRQ